MADLKYVPLQAWLCDRCGAGGEVEAPMTMVYEELIVEISAQHQQLNPECTSTRDFYLTA